MSLVLLRDRLQARLAAMGNAPDYVRLANDVLGIRNVPAPLAEQLVRQALVMEDRRDEWRKAGERACAGAPNAPGVYVLRDAAGVALYVGKANNLRRRLLTHFSARRWKALKPELARAAAAEWRQVGSELEALLREAEWIEELAPSVNIQIGEPSIETRELPPALLQDTIVLVPSIEEDSLELVSARADGPVNIQRTRRNGIDLAVHVARVWRFFRGQELRTRQRPVRAPIVFSWLAGRGQGATRLHLRELTSHRDLRARLGTLLADRDLFSERIVVLDSMFRVARRRDRVQAGPTSPRP